MRGVICNSLAASPLVPRYLRALIYRALGMRIAAWRINARCFFGDNRITIGAKTFVNTGCFFDTLAPISIGERCHLAPQVMVLTSAHTPDESHALIALPVKIEDGCWIGARATVLPGVTIGEGCIIAAGAVVSHDCDRRGLYAGVPARRVRELDDAPSYAAQDG